MHVNNVLCNINCPEGAEEVFEDWSLGLDYHTSRPYWYCSRNIKRALQKLPLYQSTFRELQLSWRKKMPLIFSSFLLVSSGHPKLSSSPQKSAYVLHQLFLMHIWDCLFQQVVFGFCGPVHISWLYVSLLSTLTGSFLVMWFPQMQLNFPLCKHL